MKHIFIINPTAGKYNQTKELQARIERVFLSLETDDTYEIYISQYVQDATFYVRKQAMSSKTIRFYACGGDGTLNEVLNGMCGHQNCSLAIIPIGTGNDFIKSFEDYVGEDFLNIEDQVCGTEIKIDVMRIDNVFALNLISSGLDSTIAKHVSKFKRLPLVKGQGAYNLSLVYCFFTSLYHNFSFRIDDVDFPKDDYIFAVAANGQYYGGGYHAAPKANMQDGLIDVICIKKVSRAKVLKLVNTYKEGKHLDLKEIVIYKRSKSLQLFDKKPFIMNIDGEIRSIKNPKIEILPNFIKLCLPRKMFSQQEHPE